jgi:hypothetical protein
VTVLILYPTGDNAAGNTLIPFPTGAHWSCVDDIVPDQSDYCSVNAQDSPKTDHYDMSNHVAESGTISNVRVIGDFGSNGFGSYNKKLGIRIGSTDYLSGLLGSVSYYDLTVNPATSAVWSWTDIDALIGVCYMEASGSTILYDPKGGPIGTIYSIGYEYAFRIEVTYQDTNIPVTPTGAYKNIYGATYQGQQTLKATVAHNLGHFLLKLYKVGTPGDLKVDILRTVGGIGVLPVIATGYLADTGVTTNTSGAVYQIDFNLHPLIELNEVFAVWLHADQGNASNKYCWICGTTDTYADGKLYTGNFTGWTDSGVDGYVDGYGSSFDPLYGIDLPALSIQNAVKSGYLVWYGQMMDLPTLMINMDIVDGWSFSEGGDLPTQQIGLSVEHADFVVIRKHPCNVSLFKDEPLQVKTVYIVGSDYLGNSVYGEYTAAGDGTNLNVGLDDSITSQEDADTIAENLQYDSRFKDSRGISQQSPHYGIELLDVANFEDAVCSQPSPGLDLRVMGFKLTYRNLESKNLQSFLLGPV